MKPNIALIGKARSGKDSAGAHLVRAHAYTRLAFADPLKEMALAIDPVIPFPKQRQQHDEYTMRLRQMVETYGWERAKDLFPEVRRLLQRMGQAQRERDEHYWVGILRRSVEGAAKLNMPVVVTDCRYLNEAQYLRGMGFTLVRLLRPGTGGDSHGSETELDDFVADITLSNDASLEHLHSELDNIIS